MILGNRLYVRKDPDRDASLCIIYCEGNKREPQYFKYFDKISSRIILEVVKADRKEIILLWVCMNKPALILKTRAPN